MRSAGPVSLIGSLGPWLLAGKWTDKAVSLRWTHREDALMSRLLSRCNAHPLSRRCEQDRLFRDGLSETPPARP